MFQIYTCLTVDHDWRLVALAGAVSLLAGLVAISIFHRARASKGRTRLGWLGLDAAAGGWGIWATHFIGMLAYNPALGTGYNIGLTILSLIIAASITGLGLTISLQSPRWAPATGGAIVGCGVTIMHYSGMLALDFPGSMEWTPNLVFCSVLFGVLFGSIALHVAARRDDLIGLLLATVLFAVAIVSMHFTAMSAVLFIPDPMRTSDPVSLSPVSLSLLIAGATMTVLGMCLVAALSDRKSQDKLGRQKVLLDTALENMSQGLSMFDADGNIMLCNENYAAMMGSSAISLRGQSLLDVLKLRKASGGFNDDPEEFFGSVMAEARDAKSSSRMVETSTGRTLRVVGQPMQGGGWVATLEDITEWQKAQTQISHMARHDSLTNLPNRTLFREDLENALRRTARDERIAVFYLDLDHFKNINDSLGHPVGDELLKQAARRLSGCLRDGDTVARLGGDEFAIVQVGSELQISGASALACRLIEVVSVPYDVLGNHVVIDTSVGISVAPDDGTDPDQLLKNADLALYRAKADGRGNYRFFEPGMDARAQARRIMELDLRAALQRGEFQLEYEPIHDLETNQIVCFEALVRWNHPHRGTLEPPSFIPLAEENGLIVPIGDWVLRSACIEAASWSQPVRVAVNFSPAQFKNRKLVSSVAEALSASGLAANRLELEITEAVLLQDSEATLATLHRLRDLGIRISMDDFGTGYSSLNYLRSFPFDKIKIDRSFINEMASQDESLAIVRAVASLGKSLGISTTADGVETKQQLALLRTEGCNEVQGHLFGSARPRAEIEQILSHQRLRTVA